MRLRIRAARPSDRRAVRELCARIWSDDYVPHVFDEWSRDRRGRLWVAVDDDRVIGIAKLTLIGDREAWLHALRVDPRHRRRGVATALLEHRLERAERLGARIARLDTSDDNIAVRRLMRRYGFRLLERFGYFDAPARAVEAPRRAVQGELSALWRLLRRGDGLLHEAYVVRRVTRADVARAIRARRCLATGPRDHPLAIAIVEPQRRQGGHGSRLVIRALGGTGRGVRDLLRAAPGAARAERLSRVGIPLASPHWPAVRAARYRRPWSETMLIFERAL